MRRILIAPHAIRGNTATISDSETLHHLLHVLRMDVGDALECSDGEGRRYAGVIKRCGSAEVVVELRLSKTAASAGVTLWLAQALIKPERFEWAIQKATELGVDRITPLITQHTVVRPVASRLERRLSRWERIVKAAAQQSGRTTCPTIDSPQPVSACLASMTRVPLILIPTLSVDAVPLKEAIERAIGVREVAMLVGPEGDFTREEVRTAQAQGACPVSLGRLTLRSETAALAMVAVLSHQLNAL